MKTRKIPYTIHYSLLTIHKPLRGFTLVEILIVVTILGILAAIIVPEYRNYTQQAKESAAKDNLRILRQTIERYAVEHNGVPPGYSNDDPTGSAIQLVFRLQTVGTNSYLSELPANPFNSQTLIKMIQNNEDFPSEPVMSSIYGWIYQPSTKTVKLNWEGVDFDGIPYFDY